MANVHLPLCQAEALAKAHIWIILVSPTHVAPPEVTNEGCSSCGNMVSSLHSKYLRYLLPDIWSPTLPFTALIASDKRLSSCKDVHGHDRFALYDGESASNRLGLKSSDALCSMIYNG